MINCNRVVSFVIPVKKATVSCINEHEAIQAHYALDCRIILDGEVDNLV